MSSTNNDNNNNNNNNNNDDNDGGGLQLVPETVLKQKNDLDELKARREVQIEERNKGRFPFKKKKTKQQQQTPSVRVIKPETILARARSRRNQAIRIRRVSKKGMQGRASNVKITKIKEISLSDNNKNTSDMKQQITIVSNSVGASLVFVVRLRDNVGIPKRAWKILSDFNLQTENDGVFLQYTDITRKMLHLVEPWVTYGIPSKSMITDLIKRRGHGKIDGQRIPISDNTIIEQHLGEKTGIICVEDLVHEIYTVGDSFHFATSFLWPFKLAAPRSKFERTKLNYCIGKDYGDRGEEMDDYIRQML